MASDLGVEDSYSYGFTGHHILKKGKKWNTFKSAVMKPVSTVKPAKKVDTLKLLEELSPPQSVLDYYSSLLDIPVVASHDSSDRTAIDFA